MNINYNAAAAAAAAAVSSTTKKDSSLEMTAINHPDTKSFIDGEIKRFKIGLFLNFSYDLWQIFDLQ